jgi:hypothetical protein
VRDFIFNNKWNIPPLLSRLFPSLQGILNSVSLPLDDPTDLLSSQHTVDGDMKLRDAYHFKSQFHYDLPVG